MNNKYTVRKNFFDEIEIEPALEGDPVSGFLFAILLVIGLGFLFFIFDASGNLLRMIVRIFFTLMVLARCTVFLLYAHRSEREEDQRRKPSFLPVPTSEKCCFGFSLYGWKKLYRFMPARKTALVRFFPSILCLFVCSELTRPFIVSEIISELCAHRLH